VNPLESSQLDESKTLTFSSRGNERQTLAFGGVAASQAQLATSIHNSPKTNTRKRAGAKLEQPEFSPRFFTAPMVGGGARVEPHLVGDLCT